MSTIKNLLIASSVAALIAFAATAGLGAENAMVSGVITEVRSDGDMAIKHEDIPNLDMPAMTMVFKMKEPKMSSGMKKGDKIKFHAEDIDGKLTVTKIEKAK